MKKLVSLTLALAMLCSAGTVFAAVNFGTPVYTDYEINPILGTIDLNNLPVSTSITQADFKPWETAQTDWYYGTSYGASNGAQTGGAYSTNADCKVFTNDGTKLIIGKKRVVFAKGAVNLSKNIEKVDITAGETLTVVAKVKPIFEKRAKNAENVDIHMSLANDGSRNTTGRAALTLLRVGYSPDKGVRFALGGITQHPDAATAGTWTTDITNGNKMWLDATALETYRTDLLLTATFTPNADGANYDVNIVLSDAASEAELNTATLSLAKDVVASYNRIQFLYGGATSTNDATVSEDYLHVYDLKVFKGTADTALAAGGDTVYVPYTSASGDTLAGTTLVAAVCDNADDSQTGEFGISTALTADADMNGIVPVTINAADATDKFIKVFCFQDLTTIKPLQLPVSNKVE